MSRSKGAGGLADLIKNQGGERIRFFLLRTHYRSTVLFNEPAIEEAGVGLETFYRLFKRYHRITGQDFYALEAPTTREAGGVDSEGDPGLRSAAAYRERFLAAMDDDFNTGSAIAELFELAKLTNKFCDDASLETTGKGNADAIAKFTTLLSTVKELAGILGLFRTAPATDGGDGDELLGSVMHLVIDLRAAAREKKDFGTADKIRDAVAAAGLVLEDRPGGTEWTGGNAESLDGMMQLLIQLRADARANKDFATADAVRDRLAAINVTLEDRLGGTEWSGT
jgi:cysteinyl-tRNA synthetase